MIGLILNDDLSNCPDNIRDAVISIKSQYLDAYAANDTAKCDSLARELSDLRILNIECLRLWWDCDRVLPKMPEIDPTIETNFNQSDLENFTALLNQLADRFNLLHKIPLPMALQDVLSKSRNHVQSRLQDIYTAYTEILYLENACYLVITEDLDLSGQIKTVIYSQLDRLKQ